MKDLIDKYLDAATSAKEKKRILLYFKAHPKELEDFFSQEEWEQQLHAPTTGSSENKISDNSRIFLENLFKEESKNKTSISPSVWWMAAASIIVLVAAIFFLSKNHFQKPAETPVVAKNASPDNSQMVSYANTTASSIQYKLPDSSIATLMPNSRIEYLKNFEADKRNINLEGDAVFKVYKDASRRFTVFCGAVATTAIGTEFKVSSSGSDGMVKVSLLEGKILVRDKDIDSAQKYYLLPGNEIIFNASNREFTLIKNPKSLDETIASSQPANENLKSHTNHSSELEEKNSNNLNGDIKFMNVSLPIVLNNLAKKYNVRISYPTQKANHINFAGTFKPTDSIGRILSDIAIMNDFKLTWDSVNHHYSLH